MDRTRAVAIAPTSRVSGPLYPEVEDALYLVRGLASVIDEHTFLEDGCKLEGATSRAPTLIVS